MINVTTESLINFLCNEQWLHVIRHVISQESWRILPSNFNARLDTLRLIVEEHLPVVLHANRDSSGNVSIVSHRHALDLLLHNTQYMYVNPRTLTGRTIAEVFSQITITREEDSESLYELLASQSTLLRIYNMKLPKENHDACELLRHSLRKIPLTIVWSYHDSELISRIKCLAAYNVLNGR